MSKNAAAHAEASAAPAYKKRSRLKETWNSIKTTVQGVWDSIVQSFTFIPRFTL